jgi:hypothetical protein
VPPCDRAADDHEVGHHKLRLGRGGLAMAAGGKQGGKVSAADLGEGATLPPCHLATLPPCHALGRLVGTIPMPATTLGRGGRPRRSAGAGGRRAWMWRCSPADRGEAATLPTLASAHLANRIRASTIAIRPACRCPGCSLFILHSPLRTNSTVAVNIHSADGRRSMPP